jgi:hypothetical protein
MYNLTNGTDVLTFNMNKISLNPGFYSAYTLAGAVTAAAKGAFTLTYLQSEGHFIFSTSTADSRLSVNTPEMAKLLGVTGTLRGLSLATSLDPEYTGQYILKSSTIILMNANEYIFLDIDELKTPSHIDAKAITGNKGTISGSNINRAFAPIMMDTVSGGMKIYHEGSDYKISVQYPEPINSLQRLTVRWYDTNGSLLDFKGSDNHAFILRLYVLEEDVRRLPPPPPLQDVEIKRIVEAMTMVPPPPPEKKTKFPWFFIFLALLAAFIAWKTLAQRVTA